ncbi:MAG: DMT family transporter, partial [Dehalococcoidia bacterium]|nr:DMT family transporter [Dehalococcoidia bacterium]
MLGEISALAGALTWAVNSVLIKSQSARMSALSLNAVQYLAATLPFLFLLPLSGKMATIGHIPPLLMAGLIGTAMISMVGGDTVYVRSLRLIGVSKAFPIAMCSYPLISSFVAVAFLGEPFTWFFAIGAVLVLGGLYSFSPRRRGSRGLDSAPPALPANEATSRLVGTEKAPLGTGARIRGALANTQTQGVMCSLLAAICWATAVLTLKLILGEVDAFTATAIRVPVAAL